MNIYKNVVPQRTIDDIELPNEGDTIIIIVKQGRKKDHKKIKCTVTAIYPNYITVENIELKYKEGFTKADFLTNNVKYIPCT